MTDSAAGPFSPWIIGFSKKGSPPGNFPAKGLPVFFFLQFPPSPSRSPRKHFLASWNMGLQSPGPPAGSLDRN